MRTYFPFGVIALLAGLLTPPAFGDTFLLTDGKTINGDVITAKDDGIQIREETDGQEKYTRYPWTKFSQETLKHLAQNPKTAQFVEPFIEITQEERIRRTAVDIKPVPRLERPAERSVLGALAGSPLGILALLLIYAANIWGAYEVALFRAQPPGLVCGVAAVMPLLGPVVFLSMPTRVPKPAAPAMVEEPVETMSAEAAQTAAGDTGGLALAARPDEAAAAARAQTQVFQRGQFTFTRRFIETKFPGFFGVIRRDAEKDMILLIKSARGQFAANRITRITANDMHIEVQKGAAAQEVQVPFLEIQELQLKHREA